MSTTDDVLKAIADMEQRMNTRLDRLERKVDLLGNTLLSPYEVKQHEFAALAIKPDRTR